jgi:YVTN family beta-propeller protein
VRTNNATNQVYVAEQQHNAVAVIDGATNTVTTTVPVGVVPLEVAVDTATNTIYAVNDSDNTVSVIDGSTNTVVDTIPVTGGNYGGAAVNSVTHRVYVTSVSGNTVSVINGNLNQVIATVSVGSSPVGVAVNSTTDVAYVANYAGNTVSVIDGTTNTVTATITVASGVYELDVDPGANQVFVTSQNNNANLVSVIDGATNSVVATITEGPVGAIASGIAVDPATHRVYVTNRNLQVNTVSVIDGSADTLIATIPVGTNPAEAAVNATTHQVYVTNIKTQAVQVIDGTTACLVGDPNVASNVDGLAAGQAEAFPYVATATGTVDHLAIYADASNQSNQVHLGLYTNTPGNQPGTALGGGSSITTAPPTGKWAVVTLAKPVTVHVGKTYWIAVLSTSGTLHFRDTPGGGTAELSASTTLTKLPQSWTSGSTVNVAPASAYGTP